MLLVIFLFIINAWKMPDFSLSEFLLIATRYSLLALTRQSKQIEQTLRPYISCIRIVFYFLIMRPLGANHLKLGLSGMKLRIDILFLVLKLKLLNRNRVKCTCLVRTPPRMAQTSILLCIGILGSICTIAHYTIATHIALLAMSGILSALIPLKPASSSCERQNVRKRKIERKEARAKQKNELKSQRLKKPKRQKRSYSSVSSTNNSRIVRSNLFWLILLLLATPVCAGTGETTIPGSVASLATVLTVCITAPSPSKTQVLNTMSPKIGDYDIVAVPPDGNCMYHAISHFDAASFFSHGAKIQLNLRESIFTHVEEVILSPLHELHKLYTNPDLQASFLGADQTIQDFFNRTKSGWGGFSDLPFFSNLLNIEFRVLKAQDAQCAKTYMMPAIKPQTTNDETIVAWLYHKDHHFSPMIPKSTNTAPADNKEEFEHKSVSHTPYNKSVSSTNSQAQEEDTSSILVRDITIEHENIQSTKCHNEAIKTRLSKADAPDFLCLSETQDTAIGKNKTFTTNLIKHNCKGYHAVVDQYHKSQEKNRGTAIIMKKHWMHLKQETITIAGCLTAIRFKHKDLEFLVAAVYIPTGGSSSSRNQKERVAVYTAIKDILERYKSIPVILIGDFNGRVSIERDHFTSSNSPYLAQDGDKRLKSLLRLFTVHDSFRRLNPEAITFTHESVTSAGPTRSRIDLALLNNPAIKICANSFISQSSLDIGLHHRTIGVTIKYAADWEFQKAQKNEANTPKICWKKLKAENTAKFKRTIELDKRIINLQKDLQEENTNLLSRTALKKLATNSYVIIATVLRQVAKATLPIININQNPITHLTKATKLREDRNELNLARSIIKSTDQIERLKGEHMLERLFEKYKGVDTIVVSDKIKHTNDRIKRKLETLEREEIAKKITKRETELALNQKRHITNILERNIEWENLTSIRDPETGEAIIDQKEIKDKLRSFFKSKSTGPTNETARISNTNILPAPLDIDPRVWDGMMKKATLAELKNAIKELPKKKACGPDGISNEILQLLNAADSIVIELLLNIMNLAITKQVYSTTVTNGVMTMLPKKEDWGGDLSKLRPITLLNTMHKLFEKLLNDRLCSILNVHQLLQGPNFGFQAGQGTAEPLFILSNMLDICKDNDTPFYTAALDVAAAFDKLPWKAIEDGLRRIKAPDSFVALLQTMHTNRTLTINTPFGKTKPFTPTIGVAQGGILSPILWLIAYDPLLQALQSNTEGITLPAQEGEAPVKICCVAYADDLHPIASTEEDLQKQLDLINSFLSFYNMEMNAKKSHILTNIDGDSCRFPSDTSFSIANNFISVKRPGEITRILGVWMSMDNLHKETRDHTIAKLNIVINMILSKAAPGSLGAFLARTVVTPQLLYRLQHTYCTIDDYNKINVLLRKVTKKKMLLPMSTRNEVLQDKRIKLDVQDFKTAHEKALISNALVFVSSRNRIGNFTRAMVSYFSTQENTPLSLFEAPLKFSADKQKKSTIKLISNMLFNHGIQLRIPNTLGSPANNLEPSAYRTHFKDLKKYNVERLSDIYDPDTRRTINYNKFCTEDESRIPLLSIPGPPPDWFIVLIRSLAKRRAIVTRQSTHKIKTPVNFNKRQLPELLRANHVQIYTDGSFKNNEMGSAAVFEIEGRPEPIVVLTQPTKNNPSANKAELAAIYMALLISHPHNQITLNYDCQSAVNDILQFQGSRFTQRMKIKTQDYPWVQAIVILLDKFDHPVTFNKIPRAENCADGPSKIARLENLPILEINEAHQSPHQYQMAVNNTLNTTYPRRFINVKHQTSIQKDINDTLHRLWNGKLNSEIDCDLTLQVATTGLDRKNHLDANLHQVQTHVINTTLVNLQTMDKRITYTDNLFEDNYCVTCDGAFVEDQEHAWKCDFAISQRQEILKNAKKLVFKDLDRPTKIVSASTINRAFAMLNLTPDSFLDNPLTKGIITKRNARRSKSLVSLLPGYASSWIVNISASLARSFWELVWRPRTAKVEALRLKLEATKRERERLIEWGNKRHAKRQRKEAAAAIKAAKEHAKEQIKIAKDTVKKQNKLKKQKERESSAAENREARRPLSKRRKRKRAEVLTDSESEEIPIYSTQELREKRANKRSKTGETPLKRKRESPIIDSIKTKRQKTPATYDLRPRRIQQSTDPPRTSKTPPE